MSEGVESHVVPPRIDVEVDSAVLPAVERSAGRPAIPNAAVAMRRLAVTGTPLAPRWAATFGFDVFFEPTDRTVGDQVTRQGEWLSQALPPRGALQIRLVASATGTLRVSMLCSVVGYERQATRTAARDAAHVLYAASAILEPATTFWPIDTTEELQRLRAFPGRRATLTEIRRSTIQAGEHELPVAALSGSGLHQLTWMLAEHARAARCAVGYIATVRDAGDFSSAPAQFDQFDSSTLPWTCESGRAVQVQGVLVSDGDLPWGVAQAMIAESTIAGRAPAGHRPLDAKSVVHTPELHFLRRAVHDLDVADWEAALARDAVPASGRTLLRLSDLRQALALARLPSPGPQGVPGILPRRTRESWLSGGTPGVPLILGENVAHRARQTVGIDLDDLRRHLYVCGVTGAGKSTLLKQVAVQAMSAGFGVGVIDPHGDLIRELTALVPAERTRDVVLLDPTDASMPVALNVMDCPPEARPYVVENFVGMMYLMFDPHRQGIVGPRFEHSVRNAMLLAMERPGASLIDVVRVLTEPTYVRTLLRDVRDPMVRNYWLDQIPATSDFHRSEILDYVVSKFSRFTHDARIRRIIGQPTSTVSFREAMDARRIVLVNLAQGVLGQETSRFLGMTVIDQIAQATYSRADLPTDRRRDFILIVDEFQQYATPAFTAILSGARKYGLSLLLANQHVHQLPPEVAHAVYGNVGSVVAFRLGVEDAPIIASAIGGGTYAIPDYLRLPNFHAIASLLRGGERTTPFNLSTLPPPAPVDGQERAANVMSVSRLRYGRPAVDVDRLINERWERANDA